MHRVVRTKKGRYVVMVQNPAKKGQFGEWKIVANKANKCQADKVVAGL
jgi:hypothetical protein